MRPIRISPEELHSAQVQPDETVVAMEQRDLIALHAILRYATGFISADSVVRNHDGGSFTASEAHGLLNKLEQLSSPASQSS